MGSANNCRRYSRERLGYGLVVRPQGRFFPKRGAPPDRRQIQLDANMITKRGLRKTMPRSIVVGTDGSKPAEEAVRQATDLASREGARLHLVAAYPDPQVLRERVTGGSTAQNVDLRGVAISVLKRAEHYVRDKGVELETHAREGDPAEVIIQVASEQQADLIVVGSRGLTGIKRFLLGSVSNKVSHHAPCSVMIVRRA